MVNPVDSVGSDDDVLTAYLDGELDGAERAGLEERMLANPALKARLDELARGGRPFGPAYDALLAAAPAERLTAMLAELTAKHAAVGQRSARSRMRTFAAIAAALVVFIAGGAAGYLWSALHPAEPPGWRQVVAEYQSLTTAETLAAITDNPAVISQDLVAMGGKLDLNLTPDSVALPDVALKRTQLFSFHDHPLVQVAYLSPADGPIALCIIANGRADAPTAFEQREGYNIVYWTKGGRGYMLIGKASQQQLEAFASDLAGRFS